MYIYIHTYIYIYNIQLKLGCLRAALIDLYVGLSEGYHLWQDFGNVQILHLVPLSICLVEYVYAICALLGITVMHNIRHQIIFGILDGLIALLHAQNIAKVHVPA